MSRVVIQWKEKKPGDSYDDAEKGQVLWEPEQAFISSHEYDRGCQLIRGEPKQVIHEGNYIEVPSLALRGCPAQNC